jgi:N4-gp56 family major capsid protein
MAKTDFPINDPLAVKIYSVELQRALTKDSYFFGSGFVGDDPLSNIIVIKNDLAGENYGDQITYAILQSMRGLTVPGGQNLKGKEQRLVYLDDKITINQQRTGINCGGKMTNKRVPYKTREDAKKVQQDYWPVRIDEEIIAKLTGSMGVGEWENLDPDASGFDVEGAVDSDGNTLRAPSTNRQAWATGTTAADLTEDSKFTLELVDKGLKKVVRMQANTTTRRKMAPIKSGGKGKRGIWICLLDTMHAFDLKEDMGGRWYDLEKAKLAGHWKGSALVEQSLGVYESAAGSVAFFSHEGMVKFNNGGAGGNVEYAAALLMGQCAGVFAPGDKTPKAVEDGLYMTWHEETDNRGDEVVIDSGMIYGFQKAAYRTGLGASDSSREDYGVCVLYAATRWS